MTQKFNTGKFNVDYSCNFDGFFSGYENGREIGEYNDSVSLDDAIPFPWDDLYIHHRKQNFEPSRFYKNIVTLCARYRIKRSNSELALIYRLIIRALKYSVLKDGGRFSTYNFNFEREGYTLNRGWVSAIGNGFVLRGLVRAYIETNDLDIYEYATQYALAYFRVNSHNKPLVNPWLTWIDNKGYIWFDEYPGDDGKPTLVLNGHIHALYGLYYFYKICNDTDLQARIACFLNGGLCTLRDNVDKFRQRDKVNRYSLREPTRIDYSPQRTVRQQRELYLMTKDSTFKENAERFALDFSKSHHKNILT